MTERPSIQTEDKPRFSVVTPSWNQARYLRVNIESVLAQDYPHVEHIVMDNASDDGSVDVLNAFPSVQWKSEPDKGQSDAINKAIQASSHEWIVWVNSDDALQPDALHTIARYIEHHPDACVIYSNICFVDAEGQPIETLSPNYSPWKMLHWWWGSVRLWQPGTIFRREVFDRFGPLVTNYHFSMDFDFYLKAQSGYAFHYLDADLVAFRKHEEQKGHSSKVRFIRERVDSTLQFWKQRNPLAYCFYSVLLFFVESSLIFVDGLRLIEQGDREQGWSQVWKGIRGNPLALFRKEHVGFWARRLIGKERYYKMKNR